MAQKSQAHDKQVLHKLGYAQELSRRMSGFSNFAISFSIICILAGGISAFPAAFNALGSGGAVLIWLVGGILAMSVAVGMGQIASSFPTAVVQTHEFPPPPENLGVGQPPGAARRRLPATG